MQEKISNKDDVQNDQRKLKLVIVEDNAKSR